MALMPGPRRVIETGMIGQCVPSLVTQPGGRTFDLFARQAIHDTAIGGVILTQKIPQPLAVITAFRYPVKNVGAVKAMHEFRCILQAQLLLDFLAGAFIGGCGQCDARYLWEQVVQAIQALVIAPEVVSPLGYAMRLIDGKQGDVALFQ